VLVQRIKCKNQWKWNVSCNTSDSGKFHAQIVNDKWNILLIGSYDPKFPAWLKSAFLCIRSPLEILHRAREQDEGHYAIVCVNLKDDELFLNSDPYAIAKIYWHISEGRITLGTKLPVVLRTISASPMELDKYACGYFFMNGYLPARHTFHRNVFKVPPSVTWHISTGEILENSYIDSSKPQDINNNEYLMRVSDTWKNSISNHQIQYKEPIIALSGGIDSTLLLSSFIKIRGETSGISAHTGVALGGKKSIILNPYDVEFSRRVSKDFGVEHTEIHYDLNAPQVVNDLNRTIGIMGTECSLGALMFQSLVSDITSTNKALFAAQNADSILSFAVTGKPTLRSIWPPSIDGLGGWCTRCNLFGGFEHAGRIDTFVARSIFNKFLKRNYNVSWKDISLEDRVAGLVFNKRKWPIHPHLNEFPYLHDNERIVEWLLNQYWEGGLADKYNDNPHGILVHMFLNNYMQGPANRGTVWGSTMNGCNTFLPFASLPILKLTLQLKPSFDNYWFGKSPIRHMVNSEYTVPNYVKNRSDPNTPELDLLHNASIISNHAVIEHFKMLLCDHRETINRLQVVLEKDWLDSIKSRIGSIPLKDNEIPTALLLYWLLEVEHQAWGG